MTLIKVILTTVLALGVTACARVDTTSRNAPLEVGVGTPPMMRVQPPMQEVIPDAQQSFRITAINVSVPKYLRVSESSQLYPVADIVWRGDPYGDRYAQIRAIFEAGLGRGARAVHGTRKVVADVVVKRFHGVTEHARYTVGGIHSIKFLLTLRDRETGVVVLGPRVVKSDLKAFGGSRAMAADRAGQTQKVRIIDHLVRVMLRELTPAEDRKPLADETFETASAG